MNDDANLYKKSNALQRRDAKNILDEFASLIRWKGHDSVLDIGCGSGDVSVDYLLPLLPDNDSQLIGVDIAEEMVKSARKAYDQPRLNFQQLDISGNVDNFMREVGQFDHVMSFFCLHWVHNQKQALSNIHKMLKPNGDCLLVFLPKNPIFGIYQSLAEYPQWAPYMKDLNAFASPYQFVDNSVAELEKIFLLAGFTQFSVTERDHRFVYEGVDNLRNFLQSVCPVIKRLPQDSIKDFLADHIELALEHWEVGRNNNDEVRVLMPYKLLVAHAKK